MLVWPGCQHLIMVEWRLWLWHFIVVEQVWRHDSGMMSSDGRDHNLPDRMSSWSMSRGRGVTALPQTGGGLRDGRALLYEAEFKGSATESQLSRRGRLPERAHTTRAE